MIDFFASAAHYLDHLMPIFQAMPPEVSANCGSSLGRLENAKQNPDPIVCSGWTDVESVVKLGRPIILSEHGAGQTYQGCVLPNYINGQGRQVLSGILVVNSLNAQQSQAVAPRIPVAAVGCPRLGTLAGVPLRGLDPMSPRTLVMAFRWDTMLYFQSSKKPIPEARSAWDHWAMQLNMVKQSLSKDWRIIMHAHPRAGSLVQQRAEELGWEFSADQEYCLSRATIWAQDNSSALWEACTMGVPVIHLNAPWYRQKAQHGLRFWQWAEQTGPQAGGPAELFSAIDELCDARKGAAWSEGRERFTSEWYGYDPLDPGASAIAAAEQICQWYPTTQAPRAEDPVQQQTGYIEMEFTLPHGMISEGELWHGDRFRSGWLHSRGPEGKLNPVRQVGHLDPGARARELENLGMARRA